VTRKVSGSVAQALRALGREESAVARITAELEKEGRIVGSATDIDDKDSAVLATAAGQWPLSAAAHIRMCAAVQPFLSGGISKTVNLPNSATVEDVSAAYMLAWKLGVKCVALYRDGCKRSQPLNSSAAPAAQANTVPSVPSNPSTPADARRRPPKVRHGETRQLSLAGHDIYLTVNRYPDDGKPCELFVRMAKWGSTEGALMDALCQAVSIGLQYGVPLEKFVEKWQGTHFAPAGFTGADDIRSAGSVLDLFAKVLARVEEPLQPAQVESIEKALAAKGRESMQQAFPQQSGLSPCCGATYRNTGNCKTCINCGSTSGGCG
jgi:ribonucleoside-diphosphate reductase alpha chain